MNINKLNIIRHKYTVFIFSLYLCQVFLSSCSYKSKNDENASVGDSISNISGKSKTQISTDIRLDYFDSIPNVFKYDGGTSLTYHFVKLDDRKYIFLSNLSGTAIVKLNGHEIYLKPDSSQFTVRKNDSYQEVWVGNGVQIILKLRAIRDIEDELYFDGILELKTKNTMRKIKIHGCADT